MTGNKEVIPFTTWWAYCADSCTLSSTLWLLPLHLRPPIDFVNAFDSALIVAFCWNQ